MIAFPCFERDLLTSYLNFLNNKSIPAAIYCQDSSVKISKKIKLHSTPMICAPSSLVDEVVHVFHRPFEYHVTYTRAGFTFLQYFLPKNILRSLEDTYKVLINNFLHFTRIRGCLLADVEKAMHILVEKLDKHHISTKLIVDTEVRSTCTFYFSFL